MKQQHERNARGVSRGIQASGAHDRMQKNVALDALRGVCAVLVVNGHLKALFFQDYSLANGYNFLVTLFYISGSLGNSAVIVFFVLSGYFVGGSILKSMQAKLFSWKDFLIARITRLWIVLIPAVFITAIIDNIGSQYFFNSEIYKGTQDYHSVVPTEGVNAYLGLTEALGNIFFLQGILVHTLGTNSALWSLAFEFWYYMIFPAILLVIIPKIPWPKKLAAASLLIVVIGLGGGELWSLFPAWLFGALLAYYQEPIRRILRKYAATRLLQAQLIATALLAISLVISKMLGGSYLTAVFVVTIPTMIFISLHLNDVVRGPLRNLVVPVSWIGSWSYTLYAIHMPVLALLASILVPNSADRFAVDGWTFIYGVMLLSTIMLICWIISLATERHSSKARRLVSSLFSRSKSTVNS